MGDPAPPPGAGTGRRRGRGAVRGRTRSIDDEMEAAVARVERGAEGRDAELVAGCRELLELSRSRQRTADAELQRRLATFVRIHEAVLALRERGSVESIIRGAPEAIATACDFDRVVIFRLVDAEMLAESFYIKGDPARAADLLTHSREHPPQLDDQVLETAMIRRRRPITVLHALSRESPTHELAEAYGTHAYVAAPILPEGRVIGFVHADKGLRHPGDPLGVDDLDRDLLWGFAEGLGHAIERAGLLERMQAQSAEVRRLITRTAEAVDAYVDSRVEVIATPHDGRAASGAARALLADPAEAEDADGSPLARLTRREREVLSLVADGATNAQIAARLVITVGTAKSHVARILRKLGAANRVEAAGAFLHARTLRNR